MVKVIFYKPTNIIGKIVAYVTKSKYSHVGLMIDEIHVSDINLGGRVATRHLILNSKNYDFLEVNQEFDIKKYRKYLDKKYDLVGAISYAIPFLKQSKKKYTCAEYVCNMLDIKEVLSPQELFENLK